MTDVTTGVGAEQIEKFGDLLRRLRIEADLTQEALAERAGLSVRAISDLERGVKRAPRFDTMRMLADGLRLAGDARTAFAATARRDAVPPGPRRAARSAAGTGDAPVPAASPVFDFPGDLLGREAERAAVVDLVRGGQARPVTLTGPGGVGKTRLSLAVAAEVGAAFPGGLWVVELAPLDAPELVPVAVAAACGVREERGGDPADALVAHLRGRDALLLLDNCEHLLEAVGSLTARLVPACPSLRVLATSRTRLGLRGEREVPLSPLPTPDADFAATATDLMNNPAVRLFVDQARAAQPGFALTDRNAAAVAETVRRLDGLPLAIELAAARTRILPPAALLARLDRRLPLLTGGRRDLPERHQTLRDAIAWSYDLLDPPDQALFRSLSVFAAGFTLDAADDVGGTTDDPSLDPSLDPAVLDGVETMVEASLLRRDEIDPDATDEREPRFRMLETIREFGLEQLAAEGEEVAARARQAAWCLALAEAAEPGLAGPDQRRWLDRLSADHDNFRAALGWSQEQDRSLALRLSGLLWRFWWIRGHIAEGRQWLERALSSPAEGDPAARSVALYGLSTIATIQADLDRARSAAEEAVALGRATGDRLGLARALVNLGSVAAYRGEHERATALLEEGLGLYRELGVKIGVPDALNELGLLAFLRGDFAGAAGYYEECVALCVELGNEQAVAVALVNLGDMRRRGGDVDRAEEHFVEALVRAKALGDRPGIAAALGGLGQVARVRGETARARERFAEALALFHAANDVFGTAECLEGLGRCAFAAGDAETAARLISAAEAVRESAGAPFPEAVRLEIDAEVVAIRATLDADTFAVAWTTGRVRPLDEIVSGVGCGPSPPTPSPHAVRKIRG